MSENWTDPVDFVGKFRELQKKVNRLERGASAPAAQFEAVIEQQQLTDIAIEFINDEVAEIVEVLADSVLIFRQDEPPVPGAEQPDGSFVPDPLPSQALWFDTNDGNRPYTWNTVTLTWERTDQAILNQISEVITGYQNADVELAAAASTELLEQVERLDLDIADLVTFDASVFPITTTDLEDGAVTTVKIGTGAVSAVKISDGAVVEAKIGVGAVTAPKITDGAVVEAKLGAGSVTSGKISDGSVVEAKLGAGSVTVNKIADSAITEAKLGAASVTAGKISDGSVVEAKLGSGSVTVNKIADGAVSTAKVADLAISGVKIANQTISETKIGDDAISTRTIAAEAITANEIAAGAVNTSKLTVAAFGDDDIPNGGFEDGLNGWFITSTNSPTLVTDAYTGSQAASHVRLDSSISRLFPVSPGESRNFTVTYKGDSTTRALVQVFWFTTAATDLSGYISNNFLVPAGTVPSSTWVTADATFTAPANARYCAINLNNNAPSGTTGAVLYDSVTSRRLIVSGRIADGAITADKVAANSITANKLAVVMGGGNLLSQSSLTTSPLTAWGGTATAQSAMDVAPATPLATGGVKVAAGSGYTFLSQTVTLQPGIYTASVWLRATDPSVTSSAGAGVRMEDGTGTGSLVVVKSYSGSVPNGWVRAYITKTVLTAGTFNINIHNSYGGTTGGTGFIYLSAPQLEQGDIYTSYSPKADEILPGSIVASMIAADTITAGQIAAGAIGASEILAGAVTANKLNVIMGGGNLLSNSSFEDVAATTSGWNVQQAATITHSSEQARQGSRSLKVVVTNTGGFRGTIKSYGTLPAGSYVFSAWVYPTTAMSLRAFMYDGAIAPEAYFNLVANAWQRISVTGVVPQGNTNSWAIGMDTGVTAQNATFYVDSVQLEQGDVITAYAPKTDEILPGTIVASMIASDTITANEIAVGAIGADEIAAGAITANKLNVIMGGGNLVRDSSFETSPLVIGQPWDMTSFDATATSTLVSTTTKAFHGSRSGLFTYGTRIPGGAIQGWDGVSQGVTSGILPNTKYTFSAWVWMDPTWTAGLRVVINMDGTFTANQNPNQPVTSTGALEPTTYGITQGDIVTTTGKWVRVKHTYTTSSDTTVMSCFVLAPVGGGNYGNATTLPATGAKFWIDAVQLEQGDVATSYSPKSDEIIPGSIVANMIAADTITATQIAVGAIGADEIAAGAITANKLNVTVGGGNLLGNSSFESTPFTLAPWTIEANATAVADTSDWYRGTRSVLLTSAGTGSAASLALTIGGLTPNTDYTFSAFVKRASGTAGIGINIHGAGNFGVIGQHYSAGTTAWRRVQLTVRTGASDFGVHIFIFNATGIGAVANTNTAAHRIDAVQLEQGDVPSAYTPKTDEILPGTIVASMIAADTITANQIATGAIGADEIAAGAITANKLNVTVGGGNLATETSHAVTLGNWYVNANLVTGTLPTISRVVDANSPIRQFSTGVLQHTTPAGSTYNWNLFQGPTLGPLIAGQKYTVSFWTKLISGDGSFNIGISNASGQNNAIASWVSPGTAFFTATTSWTRVVRTFTAAAGATDSGWYISRVLTNAAGVVQFTGWQLEQGEIVTPYTPKTDEILPGTIVANMIAADTITANQIATGAIGADEIAAGAITANKLNVVVGGGNIVADSGFASGGLAAGWVKEGAAPFDATFQPAATLGGMYVGLANAGTSTDKFLWTDTTKMFQLTAGFSYVFSAYIYRTGVSAFPGRGFVVDHANGTAGAAFITQMQLASTGANIDIDAIPLTTWTRVKIPYTPTQTGPCRLRLYSGAAAFIGYAKVQVEIGDVATAYSPKSDEILPGTVVANMIAANTITATQIAAGTITSTEIATGTITANKLNVVMGGGNILAASTLTTVGPWTGNTSYRVDTLPVPGPTPLAKGGIVFPAASTYGYLAQVVTLEAGITYTASVWYRAGTGTAASPGGCGIMVEGGTGVATTSGPAAVMDSGTVSPTWKRARRTFTVTTSGTFTVIVMATYGGTLTGTAPVYMTAPQLEQGDVVTAYAPKTDEILPGTVVANMIAANTITAGQIAAGTITATEIGVGAITAEKLTVGALGPVLVPNGSFADPPAANTGIPGWTFAAGATRVTTSPRTGGHHARITASGGVALHSGPFPVGAGDTISFLGYAKEVTATTGLYLRLSWRNAANGEISIIDLTGNSPTTSTWTRYGGAATAPAGTVSAYAQVYNVTGTVDVDDLDVRQVIASAQIADGAIIANKIAAGAITSEKLTVANLGDELIANGMFLDPVTGTPVGTTGAYGWFVRQNENKTAFAETSGNSPGGKRMVIRGALNAGTSIASAAYPVTPGDTYSFRMLLGYSATAPNNNIPNVYVRPIWYTTEAAATDPVVDGNLPYTDILAADPLTGFSNDNSTGWRRVTGTSVAPATARWGRLVIYNYRPAGLSDVYVADVSARRVIVSAQIGNGEIRTANLQADSVTGLIVNGGTIQTDTRTNWGVKITNGGITAYNQGSSTPRLTFNSTTGVLTTTGALVTDGDIEGGVIKGAVFRTSLVDSGERIRIRNDGTGGIIEGFSGVANELTPGVFDPAAESLGGRFRPTINIKSGTSSSENADAGLLLQSGSTGVGSAYGGSYAYLRAGDIDLTASSSGEGGTGTMNVAASAVNFATGSGGPTLSVSGSIVSVNTMGTGSVGSGTFSTSVYNKGVEAFNNNFATALANAHPSLFSSAFNSTHPTAFTNAFNARVKGGYATNFSDANARITVTHGLGTTPTSVVVTAAEANSAGTNRHVYTVESRTSTTFVLALRSTAGATQNVQSAFYWIAMA